MRRIRHLSPRQERGEPTYHASLGTMAMHQVRLLLTDNPDSLHHRLQVLHRIQSPVHVDAIRPHLFAMPQIRLTIIVRPIHDDKFEPVASQSHRIAHISIYAALEVANMKYLHAATLLSSSWRVTMRGLRFTPPHSQFSEHLAMLFNYSFQVIFANCILVAIAHKTVI